MTSRDEITEIVLDELKSLSPAGVSVDRGSRITQEVGLDSLAVMDLVMALEDRFDVSLPMDRLADVETVDDLAAAIRARRGGLPG